MDLVQLANKKLPQAAAVTKTVADVASNLSAVYLEQGQMKKTNIWYVYTWTFKGVPIKP